MYYFILVKTNIDVFNSQEETIYKDKYNKSKEKNKNNDKSDLLKTDKKKEQSISIMNIVKENIQEEDKDDNKEKDKDKDDNINNNINENNGKKINIIIDKKEEDKEEDMLINQINIKEKISKKEINNSPKLILEEIEGNLFNGKKIEINAGGMIGGRGKNDGFTIFGQKNINDGNNNEVKNEIFNADFEIEYAEKLLFPYIFVIYFKKEEKSYYIRAYSGKGSDNKILFIKLTNNDKCIIKQKELISAGDIIFQVIPMKDNFLEIVHLERKKTNVNKQIFEGKKNKKVQLGRSKDCDFFFPKDKSFSRIQTTFEFDDDKKEWTVIDGNENKSSTNGTWIFATHSFLIKNEMIIEVLNSKILIKEINNDNKNENDK